MRSPTRLCPTSITVLVAAAALAAPGVAAASYTSSVGADGPVMAGDAASDALLIDESGGLLRHSRFPADPGFNSGFDFDSSTAGDQTVASTPNQLTIDAGAGDDAVTVVATGVVGSTVRGGDGDDTLITSNGVDSLFGDGGNDRLVGGRGNDGFAGGDGNDVMVWNNGDNNDVMNGEGNSDETEVNGAVGAGDVFTIVPNAGRVRFDRTNLVPFNLDIGSTERLTVNGGSGADTITGAGGLAPLILLALNGGPGADTVAGGDGPDDLTGGDGNDNLAGAGGDDRIAGDRGDDTMGGDDGDDTLVWNNGDNNDTMEGAAGVDRTEVNGARTAGDTFVTAPNGARVKFDRTNLVPFTLDIGTVEALQLNTLGGDDTITAAPGAGALIGINADGGSGNDRIEARDGATTSVRCGDGSDSVVADALAVDFVLADCEAVDRAPTARTAARIRGGTVRVTGKLRKARAPLRLTCPAAATGGCTGRLTVASAGRVRLGGTKVVVVLGSARYSIRAGARKTVRVKLPSALKRIARGKRKLKVRASAVTRDATGNLVESSRRLTLRLPRR